MSIVTWIHNAGSVKDGPLYFQGGVGQFFSEQEFLFSIRLCKNFFEFVSLSFAWLALLNRFFFFSVQEGFLIIAQPFLSSKYIVYL